MSIYKEIFCEKCKKITYFKYIPQLDLDSSYWECTRCIDIQKQKQSENQDLYIFRARVEL